MFDRPPRSRSGSNSPRQESANQSSYAPNTFSVPQRTRPNNGSGQPERKRPRYDPTLLDDSASEAERLSPTRISREEPTSNVEMFSDEPLADYSLFGLEMQDLAALGQENLQGIPAQQVLKIAREKVRQKILAYLQQSGEPKDRINIVAGAELTNVNPKLINSAINDLVKTKQIERLGKPPKYTYKFLSETPQTEKILPEVARQKILAYLQQSGEPKDRINIVAGAELTNVNPRLIDNAINDLVKTKQIERLGKHPNFTYRLSATSHKEPEGSEYVVSEAAQATLDNFGLESVHVHPDGDCLYNALIQAGAPYSDAGEFREAVAGYVRDRFYNDPRSMLDYNLTEQVLGFMDLTNLGQESFINFIRTQGSFDHLVGDLTPLLISMMLDRSINIIHPNGTNDIVYPNGTAVQNADANQSHGAYTLLRFTEPNDHYYATKERQ
ncbi:OTU domain-containing protein [Chroococcidiopsis cubana]|uniref:OTU domain-containing protein n=1 Tax=Chroococcidiopsis cubana TaxID=171392 RepID=UPI000D072014|nr:OTU domain-containing protein [Chroococcidiopsis cubana]